MRTNAVIAVLAVALLAGVGCQQQGQRQRQPEKPAKGLSRIYFDLDRSDIKDESRSTLSDNADWLKKNKDSKVTIEGHCDERGTEEYNIALGQRRASSTKSYLVNLGISANRLSTKSYGEERPVETCHNESCWWKNRRAEFVK